MKPLTERQKQILDYWKEVTERDGMPPNIAEAARNFKMNPNGAQRHVNALVKKGFLKPVKGHSGGVKGYVVL